MRRVIVSEFVSRDLGGADGCVRRGWAFRFNRGLEGTSPSSTKSSRPPHLLLGRRTYEGFAKCLALQTDEVGFADKMNSMPKVVVATTLQAPDWNNATLIDGNLARRSPNSSSNSAETFWSTAAASWSTR